MTTDVSEVIRVLKEGGVVVYPTETSYGIGCDATNNAAIDRVFSIKHRVSGKGGAMLLPAGKMPMDYGVDMPEPLQELAHTFWPGPLTIVCRFRDGSPLTSSCFTPGERAFRQSPHSIANALVDGLGLPLLSTSANISGESELYSAQEIFARFSSEKEQPDCIFDAGTLPQRLPSTLVAWDDDAQKVVVLRQGEVIV